MTSLESIPAASPDGSNTSNSGLDEFRDLCQLLTLVTAVNDPQNRSRLLIANSAYIMRHSVSEKNSVMHAAANILVREHEILACMFEKPPSDGTLPATLLVAKDNEQEEPEYGMRHSVDTPRLTLTTTANPDQNRDFSPQEFGSNRWFEVLESTGFRFLQEEVPFLDHVATVSGYLNHYKDALPSDRNTLSTPFYHYLTSISWKKNHRRINKWTMIAMIERLDLATPFLKNFDTSQILTTKPDSLLAGRLVNLKKTGFIHELLLYVRSRTIPGIPLLLSRCEEQPPPVLYSEETYLEFHDLLVTVLVAYAKVLQNMYSHACAKKISLLQREAIIATDVARLLMAIVNSHAFESHLGTLERVDALSLSTYTTTLKTFALHNRIQCVRILHSHKKVRKSGCEGASKREVPSDGADEADEADDAHEADNADEADNDDAGEADGAGEAEDIDEIDFPTKKAMVHGRLKTLVSHYMSKRILEHYCAKYLRGHANQVQIRFLDARGTTRQVSNWEKMKCTIKNALSSQDSSSVEEAIKVLESEIKNRQGNPIFAIFRCLLKSEEVKRHFLVHCETFLMALALFGPPSNQSMADMLNNLDRKQVAVSKPCCPACWEFSLVLKKVEPSHFNVRAHHSTLHPVELPDFLPKNVIDMMVQRFRDLLCIQLETMLQNHHMEETYCPESPESLSGLSIDTNESEKSDLQEGSSSEHMQESRDWVDNTLLFSST